MAEHERKPPAAAPQGDDLDVNLCWPADDDADDELADADAAVDTAEPGRTEAALLPSIAGRVDAVDAAVRRLAGRVEEIAADVGSVLDAVGALAAIDVQPVPPPAPPAPPEPPDLEPLRKALAELRTLVEVVVDTMPGSDEGSGADLADRVADAVAARLDADALARDVAERLQQHFEVVTEDGG
jgi:hypothetical protein